MSSDIKLQQDVEGVWDIDFSNGDFELTDGLDTAIYMSVLCDKRAAESEVQEPTLRKGHFTDEFSSVQGYEVGSKFWIYTEQAKNTESNALLAEGAVVDGLNWMIEDSITSKNVAVVTRESSRLNVEVNLTGRFGQEYYNMFINTFNGN